VTISLFVSIDELGSLGEELRGEGESPPLTPETLAQKLGETLGGDDDLS
jgi:hypothetical protein